MKTNFRFDFNTTIRGMEKIFKEMLKNDRFFPTLEIRMVTRNRKPNFILTSNNNTDTYRKCRLNFLRNKMYDEIEDVFEFKDFTITLEERVFLNGKWQTL